MDMNVNFTENIKLPVSLCICYEFIKYQMHKLTFYNLLQKITNLRWKKYNICARQI